MNRVNRKSLVVIKVCDWRKYQLGLIGVIYLKLIILKLAELILLFYFECYYYIFCIVKNIFIS